MVEAINGVNSNNNAWAYTAGGAAAGAVAGGLGGYMSKPYVRNYLPTDGFCDAFVSQLRKMNPNEAKQFDEGVEFVKNLDSVEPLKFKINVLVSKVFEKLDDEKFAQLKTAVAQSQEKIKSSGIEGAEAISKFADAIVNAENPAQLKGTVSNLINKGLDSLDVNTIKDFVKTIEDNSKIIKKAVGSAAFFHNFDITNKKFFEVEGDPFNAMVRKAAKHVQLKTAGIYGAIGAAVVGAGAYLASALSNKNNA